MRPRSRLMSKRRLPLPTIREGMEEMIRDLNGANTLHHSVSSEDYLLSICHLAHPTFPTRDFTPNNNHTHQFDAVHQRLRSSRLSRVPTGTFHLNTAGETPATDMQQGDGKELGGEVTFGSSDPLERLYGHRDDLSGPGGLRRSFAGGRFAGQARSRAHSIPRDSSPDLAHQRKSSSPELYTSRDTTPTTSSLQSGFSLEEVGSGRSTAEGGADGERQKKTVKQSLISQWFSDCRSAWREASVRACMLPAIAEI